MTRIQRIALALGALVLLAAGAAAVFVATFDANRYKPLAIDWMRNEKQRTLAIDGPIELSLLPRLAVKVSRLRLSERGRPNDEFASVDEASLSLRLLPLLRKQVVVDRVQARGVRARLVRDAQGRRNIDDLLSREPAPAAPAPSAAGSAMQLDIGGVRIDEARIVLRDATVPLEGTVTLASFASGRLAPGVSTALSLKATMTLTRPQALQLALDGGGDLLFDAVKGSASLKAAKLRVTGDTTAVKALDATLEGALAWDGAALDAGPLQVAVAGAKAGGVTLAASRLDVKRLVYSSATQRLELEAFRLAMAGRRGSDPFELALDWPQLAATGERLLGSGLAGRFKLGGGQALAGRFESGAPGGSFDAVRLPGFALKVDGSIGPRKIDAELKSNLLLRPGKGAASLDKLALRARLDEPGLQPLQLSLDGQAGIDAKAAQWALQGALNTNRFESTGNAAFGGKVPNLQASARFDRLDLNQLLAPNQPAAATAAAPADTPVQLDGLTALNGRFNLAAGQLVFRQYKVADAKLDAVLDDGTLRVQRLAGGAWGGSVDASGSAQARSQRISIRLAASGVNANALLKDVAGKDLLEGTGRVSADLTTSGASLGALRANLAGSAALQLRDGAIKGVNLARTLRQAKAALSLKRDAVTKAQATEKTDFSELTASARIAGGVAESDDLDVKSPFLRIGGAGSFDIGRGRVDYTARATVIGAPAGQDGAELAALKGVTVPVQLSGPFEAIDWKIQWSGVAAAAAQSRLKDKLAEKLGATLGAPKAASAPASAPDRPKDKLKEKLRGLFGQ